MANVANKCLYTTLHICTRLFILHHKPIKVHLQSPHADPPLLLYCLVKIPFFIYLCAVSLTQVAHSQATSRKNTGGSGIKERYASVLCRIIECLTRTATDYGSISPELVLAPI